MKDEASFFHEGMAEALGVTPANLERMTLRKIARLAHAKGFKIEVGSEGSGPGLTFRAVEDPMAVSLRD